jgi:hypothetical protein
LTMTQLFATTHKLLINNKLHALKYANQLKLPQQNNNPTLTLMFTLFLLKLHL